MKPKLKYFCAELNIKQVTVRYMSDKRIYEYTNSQQRFVYLRIDGVNMFTTEMYPRDPT